MRRRENGDAGERERDAEPPASRDAFAEHGRGSERNHHGCGRDDQRRDRRARALLTPAQREVIHRHPGDAEDDDPPRVGAREPRRGSRRGVYRSRW